MQTRLLAIFAALLATIALIAGCSSKSQDSSKELPDAATLLKESSETTKSQSSVHMKLTVQGEIKELPIESLEGDLTNTPAVAAQGTANIVFLGQRLQDVDFVVADGIDTVRVTGTVSADAVNKIAPQLGATGPVPGTAWIREDGNHELVQAKLEPSPGNSITMTCSDWGKSVTVTKPTV